MEILFITHKYPPSVGGMQKQSFELISGIEKRCKVHKLVLPPDESKITFFYLLKKRVKKILEKNPGIDLIHLNDGLMAIFSLGLRKITNIPIVVTIHGLDIVLPSKIFQTRILPKFKNYQGFIAVSKATGTECEKRGLGKNLTVVRNGVDVEMASIPTDPEIDKKLGDKLGIDITNKKILVTIGRPVERKGFSWFLKNVLPELDDDTIYLMIGPKQKYIRTQNFFLSLLPKRLKTIITLIFGIGFDEIRIHNILKNPEINSKAFYLGKTKFGEMVQILKRADMFIMPNISIYGDAEGFGLVALEATICGTPVLASGIEGITDAIIDNENGYLLPSESPLIWSSTIKTLLSDPVGLRKFGEKAKDYTIENYSWEHMVDGYLEFFQKVVDNNSR